MQFNDDCVCGGTRERPNPDCERCQMLAEIDRLRTKLADSVSDETRIVLEQDRDEMTDDNRTEQMPTWLSAIWRKRLRKGT